MKDLDKILDEAVRRGLTEALQGPRASGRSRRVESDETDHDLESTNPSLKEPLTSLP